MSGMAKVGGEDCRDCPSVEVPVGIRCMGRSAWCFNGVSE